MKVNKIVGFILISLLIAICLIAYFTFNSDDSLKLLSEQEPVKWWIFEWYWWAIIILTSIVTPLLFVLFYLIRKNRKLKKKVLAIKIEEKGVLVGSKNFIDN